MTKTKNPYPFALLTLNILPFSFLQEDITRGQGMVDSLFQGYSNTHQAIMSSEEYLSQARKTFNNVEDGFYISPAFLDKISIHVAKNFMDLPKIKVRDASQQHCSPRSGTE